MHPEAKAAPGPKHLEGPIDQSISILQRKIARIERLLEAGDEESRQKAEDLLLTIPGEVARQEKLFGKHLRYLQANTRYRTREEDQIE